MIEINGTLAARAGFTPRYIGISIVLGAALFLGSLMWAGSCPAPTTDQMGVVTAIPMVYLVLVSFD